MRAELSLFHIIGFGCGKGEGGKWRLLSYYHLIPNVLGEKKLVYFQSDWKPSSTWPSNNLLWVKTKTDWHKLALFVNRKINNFARPSRKGRLCQKARFNCLLLWVTRCRLKRRGFALLLSHGSTYWLSGNQGQSPLKLRKWAEKLRFCS